MTPSGGPIDTLAPILLNVEPANFSTNFSAKEVRFYFNEYLQIKDASSQILISPPILPRPTFSLKGKGFVMRFQEGTVLGENTTYKIDFGTAIRDNNEGNVAKRFEYIFSTGKYIDSLVMSGRLVDAVTGAEIVNGFVMYYADEMVSSDSTKGDSTIYKGKQLSVARTDSTGNFIATNLKPMDYRIFAILDDNGNQTYDIGSDLVGLSNQRFNPATLDEFKVWIDPIKDRIEVTPQMKLDLFMEKKQSVQSLSEIKRVKEFEINMFFAADSVEIVEFKIDSLSEENIIMEYQRMSDTVKVWISPTLKDGYVYKSEKLLPDTLKGMVSFYKTTVEGEVKIDTSKFELSFFKSTGKRSNKAMDKATVKMTSFFDKFVKWVENLFMSKARKQLIARALRARAVADSMKLAHMDSMVLVMRNDSILMADSLVLRAKLDSIELANNGGVREIKRDSLLKFKPAFSENKEFSPLKKVYITSEYPFSIDTSLMSVMRISYPERSEDFFDENAASVLEEAPTVKTPQEYRILPDSTNYTRWILDIDWQPKSEYHITIMDDGARDVTGAVNDSLTTKLTTANPELFSVVNIDIKLVDSLSNKAYIVTMMDSSNNVVATRGIIGEGRVSFQYLQPKKYKLKFVEDANANGRQDFGSINFNREPERVENYYAAPKKPLFLTKAAENFDMVIYPEKLFDDSLVIDNYSPYHYVPFKKKEVVEKVVEEVTGDELVDEVASEEPQEDNKLKEE